MLLLLLIFKKNLINYNNRQQLSKQKLLINNKMINKISKKIFKLVNFKQKTFLPLWQMFYKNAKIYKISNKTLILSIILKINIIVNKLQKYHIKTVSQTINLIKVTRLKNIIKKKVQIKTQIKKENQHYQVLKIM